MANAKKTTEVVKPVAEEVEAAINEVKTENDLPFKDITIDISDAKHMLDLFDSIESADAHFKTCQSVNFRQFVAQTAKAPKVEEAFRKLRQKFEEAK